MRIIRVSGCHECVPYAKEVKGRDNEPLYYCCVHPEIGIKAGQSPFFIGGYIDNKTLPDYCPLEEDFGFTEKELEKARVFLKTIPDLKPYFKSAK